MRSTFLIGTTLAALLAFTSLPVKANDLTLNQFGVGNDANVSQSGSGDTAVVVQAGTGNSATIVQ